MTKSIFYIVIFKERVCVAKIITQDDLRQAQGNMLHSTTLEQAVNRYMGWVSNQL